MPIKDKELRRAYDAQRYKTKREEIIKHVLKYQRENKDKVNRAHRKWYTITEAKEKASPRLKRNNIKERHGITVEEYYKRLKSQENLCGLCGEPFYGKAGSMGSPVLDHNHTTEQLRDFLHRSCNAALGQFKDDPAMCRLAASYLEKHEENSMYQAKDGKKFGSKFAGRRYDSVHGGDEKMDDKHEEAEKPEFEMGEKEGAEEGKDEKEMHPVVAEHGKAHKVHIHHDHLRNKHHVTTMHEDGHVHESDHENAKDAHAEGQQLAGIDQSEPEQEEKNPAMSGGHQDMSGGESLMGNM